MAQISITDHALVRWLERVGGMEMEPFRQHIRSLISDSVEQGFSIITIDGFTYTVDRKKNSLITVLGNEMRSRKGKCKNKRPRDNWTDREAAE